MNDQATKEHRSLRHILGWGGESRMVAALCIGLIIGAAIGARIGPDQQHSDVAVPQPTDIMQVLSESGADISRVEADEVLGEGLLTQSRRIRMKIVFDSEEMAIVFHMVPWLARLHGAELPDPATIEATQTTHIGGTEVLIRETEQVYQVVTECYGLAINVMDATESVGAMAMPPAYELVNRLLDAMRCP